MPLGFHKLLYIFKRRRIFKNLIKQKCKRSGRQQVSSFGVADKIGGEVMLVFALDLLDSNDNGSLLADHRTRDRPRPWTMTSGTRILQQRAGMKTTSSIGSTPWAMTRAAFLASMRATMWLRPVFHEKGFLECYIERESGIITTKKHRGVIPCRPSPYPRPFFF